MAQKPVFMVITPQTSEFQASRGFLGVGWGVSPGPVEVPCPPLCHHPGILRPGWVGEGEGISAETILSYGVYGWLEACGSVHLMLEVSVLPSYLPNGRQMEFFWFSLAIPLLELTGPVFLPHLTFPGDPQKEAPTLDIHRQEITTLCPSLAPSHPHACLHTSETFPSAQEDPWTLTPRNLP